MQGNALLRLAQRALRTPPGRALGQPAYVAVAKLVAARLARMAHVDAVLGAGSLIRPELLAPGYSDIDLFVLTDAPTVDAELVLRVELTRMQKQLNRAVPLFKTFDYVETRDLPWIRDLGNEWSLGLDQRFARLAGRARLERGVAASAADRELEHLVASLRRWSKASTTLLDPGLRRDPYIDLRGAQRMLSDFLAARLDVERLQPLPRLLRQAQEQLGHAPPKLAKLLADPDGTPRMSGPTAVRELVIAALELLDDWCMRFSQSFDRDWNVRASEGPAAAAASTPADYEHARACALHACSRFGFTTAQLAPGTPGTRPNQLVLVSPAGEPIDVATARMSEWLAYSRVQRAPHPLFLTHGLLRAAALLDPAPFVGATLASARAPLAGSALPPPQVPPPAVYRRLLVGRVVQGLWRLNGRALRFGREAREAIVSTLEELELAHRSLSALGGEPLSLAPLAVEGDERAMVSALREYRAQVREALRTYARA